MDREYVLYVGRSADDPSRACPGSAVAAMLVEQVRDAVHVQDTEELLRRGKLPPWLDGTPVLVHRASRYAFKGSSCLTQLQAVAEERRSASRPRTSFADPGSKAPAAPPDPEPVGFASGDPMQAQLERFESFDPVETPSVGSAGGGGEREGVRLGEGKVTERALEEYMRLREKTAPKGPPQ